MNRSLTALLIGLLILNTAGCQDEEEQAPLGTVAKIGNAGGINGRYIIDDLWVQTIGGGWVRFNYGAVSGYPGASADIGGMGVPAHINGTWSEGWDNEDDVYYRIDAPIDAALAEQKIRTLLNYYQNYPVHKGSMQVIVDRNRVQVMYSLICVSKYSDCSPKTGADPYNWVVKSPGKGVTDVVVLFDGKGETSPTPFEPSNPYE
ncbi:hypothetical protein [Vibrio neptunius]|uniref:Lipoprotein n=1 Tax=Vibrio neptunius TaxID=170651 RepID=A0ABS2ZX01_9VIBR|nr:hypothetical protein [Vibrio neptunius]MBN3492169.1 hypothetical protein [Vibrio neptunius]MBN3514666.1 hypothetical protein [Vibrio neptunius]MBN3549208.1 hypothetical protein [Vibrio neptunius]MBN3576733.1 hypothetical protein [Vibrio neptunius]MCH9870397.1 hypothetical protein [Vibrio neptunius]